MALKEFLFNKKTASQPSVSFKIFTHDGKVFTHQSILSFKNTLIVIMLYIIYNYILFIPVYNIEPISEKE